MVLAFVILVPTLVMIVTLMSTKKYKSSAKLFVRLGRENAGLDATATLGEKPVISMPLSRESEINSISEMILNKSLFGEVVDEIGPERVLKKKSSSADEGEDERGSSPGLIDRGMAWLIEIGVVNDVPLREKAIIKLQKNLTVEPVDKSNVVLVEYESHDPKLSQDVVECLTGKYLLRHGEIHRASGAYEFLEEQTGRLQNELATKETQFEQMKQSSGVIDIVARRGVLVNRAAKIRDEKIEVDAQVEAMQRELKQLETLRDSTQPDMVLEETVGVGNEGVDGMRQELYRLELQRENLQATFDETHPRVKNIIKQIANAEKILAKAELDRKESKRGPNRIYQNLVIEINIKQPQLEALKAKSAAYQAELDKIAKEKAEFAALETSFTKLNRQITLDDANYRKYVNNLEQAKIDNLLRSQNLSNISIAQPASLELKPSKPNKLLNLILGVAFGILMGISLAVYREFKTVMGQPAEQLQRETELPLVGTIGTIPQSLQVQPELATANEE